MTRLDLCGRPLSRSLLVLSAATWIGSAAVARPQVWGQQPSTMGQDRIDSVILDGAGGTVEVGYSDGPLGGPVVGGLGDLYAARRDAAGNVLWKKQWGTTKLDALSDAVADGAGGFYSVGNTDGSLVGTNLGGYDALIVKLDLAGNVLWSDQIGTVANDAATAVASDGAGGCFVVGTTEGPLGGSTLGDLDVWVARYDATGSRLWTRKFGTNTLDLAMCAEPDGSGGVFIGGSSMGDFGAVVGELDYFCSRMDSAGNLLWVRQFGTIGQDFMGDLLSDGAGGAYLGGTTTNTPILGAMLARINAAGNFAWVKLPVAPLSESIEAIAPDGAGGICVGGRISVGSAVTGIDSWLSLARFAADGTPGPKTLFGSTGTHNLNTLVWDGTTGWTAAGNTLGNLFGTLQGWSDAWIARFESCDLNAFSNYCTASVNSTGKGASIGTLGSPYLSSNDLALTALNCPPNQVGIFILGNQSNNVPFGNGVLCVGGAIQRLLPADLTASWGGVTHPLDFTDPSSPASQITAGSTWKFQFWYRDVAAGGAGFNLSNGLSATFCP